MDPEKVISVIERYQERLERENVPKIRMNIKKTFASLSRDEILAHAHFITDNAKEYAKQGKLRKMGSHLTVVQMCLSFAGWYSLEELMNHNRPDGVIKMEDRRKGHRLDTDKQIFFYENEFYVFSNFSSFMIEWKGKLYMTSEHAYHAEKFEDDDLKEQIRNARSAHDALKLSHENRDKYRNDWDKVKLSIMREILRAKVSQHPYIKKKLLESGDKELVEDSWRDSFWGWGPNKDGKNHLGKLWMELRDELRS